MSKKVYPLDIENVSGDVYIVMSRGHHDIHAFMKQVREDGYDWPLGVPEHCWMKTVPDSTGEFVCRYIRVTENTRGAWPATYSWESYWDDRYEVKFQQNQSANQTCQ